MSAIEIVTLRPRKNALPELKAIRSRVVEEYRDKFPDVTAQWFEQEDGTLLDIWVWPDRETAETALADAAVSPTFTNEWQPRVELISFAWANRLVP